MVYTVSRDQAGKTLGVSTRTIDRYISAGKIRAKREGKVIMLHQDDVKKYHTGSEQKDYEVIAPKPTMTPSISYDPRESQNEILRAIESLIREKDIIIQELTFKIGKMEGEIAHSVPKLEYKKTILALEEAQHNRLHDMDMMAQAKREIEQKLNKERILSTILMIGMLVLLVASAFLIFHFFSLREATQYTI
ncbi:MAG: helix-turn-helix domain-containing protein [Candidatus Gracilibacteria bacterium]|jgi:excisionase family DNA binding protein